MRAEEELRIHAMDLADPAEFFPDPPDEADGSCGIVLRDPFGNSTCCIGDRLVLTL